MCKDIKRIEAMVHENIEKYNDELFNLDNEIKKIKNKIETYKKLIYEPIIQSDEYQNVKRSLIVSQKSLDVIDKIKKKKLYRLHLNSKRLIPIKCNSV